MPLFAEDVTIGVNFHWERKEAQTFLGTLSFVVESDKILAINELPVEKISGRTSSAVR